MKLAQRILMLGQPLDAGTPWTPAELATVLWLDTSDATTATTVDGKISQRADKSGNSRHATQTTSGYRPVAGTNKDDYDGSDDMMVVANTSALDAPAYIAIVVKANITSQFSGLLDKWADANGWMIDFGPNASLGYPRLSVNGSEISAPSSVHNTLSVIEAQISGESSFIGTPAGVTTGTLPSPTTVVQDLFVAGDGASTLTTDLDFHEMLILASAPDSATRSKIQGYLAHKWDSLLGVSTLVSALLSGHPYKTSPPVL